MKSRSSAPSRRVPSDEKWMRRAIGLAVKGRFGAHPDPMVGAVIVKNGICIGEGFHKRFGGPHAEIIALKEAGLKARHLRDATLYVTLEPCSTYGKTPPCTEAIIKAQIKRVVTGAFDPNPVNHRRSSALLKRSNIKIRAGVLEKECTGINPVFNKYIRTGRPYVTLKIAQSLDGKITDARQRSKWITNKASRKMAHELRAEADAILTGINTVIADDPHLDVRGIGVYRQPARIILDTHGRIPDGSFVLKTAGKPQATVIATTKDAQPGKIKRLKKTGADILILPKKESTVSLRSLIKELGGRGISHVLVEGGSRVAGSFVDEGFVDRFVFFIAPAVIGGEKAKSAITGSGTPLRGARSLRGGSNIRGRRNGSKGHDLLGLRLNNISFKKLHEDFVIMGEPCLRGS